MTYHQDFIAVPNIYMAKELIIKCILSLYALNGDIIVEGELSVSLTKIRSKCL